MGGDSEFNSLQFEKKLSNLKDSQDSINACCIWCLDNRQHHKKIVATWLNVLKRVKVEQRLTLFYLANDVIQYSKRKSYEFVESWGTALQKATTMVRDERVKHKILRIFKIWEQRGVYGEEFITDLSGLISASPSAKKSDESLDFQPTYLINKIRSCAKLEADTDSKLNLFKKHNPKLLDGEALVSSLKDRAHVDDVEKEMDDYIKHMEEYVHALKLEIKARNSLINLLLSSETQLEKDRKDLKVVAVAYKSFATRVKSLKKKLDEKKASLCSPIPSPDINAPSPSPDSDLDLPESECAKSTTSIATPPLPSSIAATTEYTYSNPGFYNPISTTQAGTSSSFMNNGFSSFLGANLPFNMQNLDQASLFSNNSNSTTTLSNQTHTTDSSYVNNSIASLFPSIIQPPPPPAPVPPVTTSYQYSNNQMPLVPPPLPPFTKTDGLYGNDSNYNEYSSNYGIIDSNQTYNTQSSQQENYAQPVNTSYEPYNTNNQSYTTTSDSFNPVQAYDPYNADEYNPEEEVETWDNDTVGQWDQPPQDTPASPPPLEKESFLEPIEYHEGQSIAGAVDVDHRVLLGNKLGSDKKKDVDHRNLISLTGSPKDDANGEKRRWTQGDQDYRVNHTQDKDYRLPSYQTDASSKKSNNNTSPRKIQDNNESIDMELSDDENNAGDSIEQQANNNGTNRALLPPPPPFIDDIDANNFLDSLNETYEQEFQPPDNQIVPSPVHQQTQPPPPPPQQQQPWNNNLSNIGLDVPPDFPNDAPPGGGWMEGPAGFHPNSGHMHDMRMRGRGNMVRMPNRGHRGEFNNRGRPFRGGNNPKFRGGSGSGGGVWTPGDCPPPMSGGGRGNRMWGRGGRTMRGIRGGFMPRGFRDKYLARMDRDGRPSRSTSRSKARSTSGLAPYPRPGGGSGQYPDQSTGGSVWARGPLGHSQTLPAPGFSSWKRGAPPYQQQSFDSAPIRTAGPQQPRMGDGLTYKH